MSDDELFAKARTYEGTDPSDDIPAVVALTPLEVAAFALSIRLEALKEAADLAETWDGGSIEGHIISGLILELAKGE